MVAEGREPELSQVNWYVVPAERGLFTPSMFTVSGRTGNGPSAPRQIPVCGKWIFLIGSSIDGKTTIMLAILCGRMQKALQQMSSKNDDIDKHHKPYVGFFFNKHVTFAFSVIRHERE